jgi:predicted MPP superfamily phosphohydrolase
MAGRVAVLSDVHGNAVALEAVLREVADVAPDLVVFGGDLTWGPLPEATRALVQPFEPSAVFVRGNAERALAEAARADASGEDVGERERWMLRRHAPSSLAFLAGFLERAVAYRSTDDPRVEETVEILFAPPEPAEVVEHAERLELSG